MSPRTPAAGRPSPFLTAALEMHPGHPRNRRRVPPPEDVYDFIARVRPHHQRPVHLDPIVQILNRPPTERTEAVTATPPRHGKTETILAAVVRMLERDPTLKIAYVSYAAEIAESKNIDMRLLAHDSIAAWERLGIDPPMQIHPDRENNREWRTTKGGMVVATGIGGALTSLGFNWVIVDDPFKGRAEAQSRLIRQRTADWFDSVAYTRRDVGPRGTSFLVNATRWHPDDLSGRLIRKGWESVNLPALDDTRGALWPWAFSREDLEKIRAHNPKEFAALFQGQPVADGDSVFGEARYYDELPTGPYSTSVGIDLAYSTKTTADYSVAVVLRLYGDGCAYVVDVLRLRVASPDFKAKLMALLVKHAVASGTRLPPVRWYNSGTEKGVVDFYSNANDNIGAVPIIAMNASADKLARAQDVAAAWNRELQTVRVPRNAPWLGSFLDEVGTFTGIADEHDDQVDALAAGYVPMVRPPMASRRGNLPSGYVL